MLIVAFGTRPELLKIEPLLEYWQQIGFSDWKVWLTFQHEELCKQLQNDWKFKEHVVGFEKKSHYLTNVNKMDHATWTDNRLDFVVSSQMLIADDHVELNDYKAILVQGDTASAFACALAAFHRKIPVIHLEAGLRSWNQESPYPEEAYRRMISMISSINLCPTWKNEKTLTDEKVPGKSFVVGNTILDSLKNKNIIPGFSYKILVTLHRREKIDEIEQWFKVIEQLAEQNQHLEFILPIHKNPAVYRFKDSFRYVRCTEPLEHDEFINILKDVQAVITDSGGVAEESSYLGKRIFLCRESTERQEAWQFYTWCYTPEDLLQNFNNFVKYNFTKNLEAKCPFGDGNSCKYITNILINEGVISLNK